MVAYGAICGNILTRVEDVLRCLMRGSGPESCKIAQACMNEGVMKVPRIKYASAWCGVR